MSQRARLLAEVRSYFAKYKVMEVETPLISQGSTTDPMIESFAVPYGGVIRYLHTSPEFAMKRLLAAGSGDIYQICRVFRAGEEGRYHNPEFTLLEWYRIGWDEKRLAHEVVELIGFVSHVLAPTRHIDIQFTTYGAIFQEYLGLDPYTASVEELLNTAASAGLPPQTTLSRDGYLDLLMGMIVAPRFEPEQLTVVTDYPASQAALARIRKGNPPVAARFEVFAGPLELANGFYELSDPAEQEQRLLADEMTRAHEGLSERPYDRRFLAALKSGLPDCAGVALGLDRLLLWLTDGKRLSEVMAFSWERA